MKMDYETEEQFQAREKARKWDKKFFSNGIKVKTSFCGGVTLPWRNSGDAKGLSPFGEICPGSSPGGSTNLG